MSYSLFCVNVTLHNCQTSRVFVQPEFARKAATGVTALSASGSVPKARSLSVLVNTRRTVRGQGPTRRSRGMRVLGAPTASCRLAAGGWHAGPELAAVTGQGSASSAPAQSVMLSTSEVFCSTDPARWEPHASQLLRWDRRFCGFGRSGGTRRAFPFSASRRDSHGSRRIHSVKSPKPSFLYAQHTGASPPSARRKVGMAVAKPPMESTS